VTNSRFTMVDLFCGVGGLSSGFIASGFQPLLAIDRAEAAVATYARNLGRHARRSEIDEETEIPASTVVVGGPPCQGFSSAGLRKAGDSRNSLVSCFADLVRRHKPDAFVFENVEGFLTAEDGARVFDLLVPLVEAGYRIHLRKVNLANHGIPQHRKRVIAIGGLGWDPSFPEPTHFASGAPGSESIGRDLPSAPTLGDVLEGLPPPSTTPPGEPQGHYYRPLEGIDLARARALEPGQTMRDLPAELWHESFARRAFRRVMDGTPTERRGGPPSGVKRLRADVPSKTITSGATAEFLHPTEDRTLTLRECAAIQTFADDFAFQGGHNEQALLIGNAVPPAFARILASHLAADLARADAGAREGALLSFTPTASSGMSPALSRLARRVYSMFQRDGAERLRQGTLWP